MVKSTFSMVPRIIHGVITLYTFKRFIGNHLLVFSTKNQTDDLVPVFRMTLPVKFFVSPRDCILVEL